MLTDDLCAFMQKQYAEEKLSAQEIERIVTMLMLSPRDPLYEANKSMFRMLTDGFVFRRDDKTLRDLFIRLIDFDTPSNNLFKVVNQFEVQGAEFRILDAVVFVNGIPLIVIEYKSAVRENATIYNAYE